MRSESLVKLDRINGVELWIWAPADPLSLGNKRYKLQPALSAAVNQDYRAILSFGGAYSNHLHALSILCKQHKLDSIGVVRGEAQAHLNATLSDVRDNGMLLAFVTRAEYRQRSDPAWLNVWQQRYPDALVIGEGGSSADAVTACEHLLDKFPVQTLNDFDVIACASGTGATVAGLARRYRTTHSVRAYDVVGDSSTPERIRQWCKRAEEQETDIEFMGGRPQNYPGSDIPVVNAAFGGYAVGCAELYDAIERVLESTAVLLDPVYTAKVWMQLLLEAESGVYTSGTRVLMIHTGGLQGWRGKWKEATEHLQHDTLRVIQQQLHQCGLRPPV